MSDLLTCPGCGAKVRFVTNGQTLYACNRWSDREPTMECLLRQLAQRDERIGELEAERDQLRADLAALEARAMQLEEALKDVIQADIARQHGVPISVVDIAGKALEG